MKYGCQSMTGELKTVLIKKPEHAFRNQQYLKDEYQAYGYLECPDLQKVQQEFAVFEELLRKNTETVLYLPYEDSAGMDSIYTHDTVKVTKNGAIYFPMGKKLRQGEPAATRRFLESIGIPTLGTIGGEGKMEGGDVVWLDEETVAIGRGYRTNAEGIRQFQNLTADIVKETVTVPMPHGEGAEACLHLMSIISMVDTDLAVVYSRYMPVFFRELLLEREIQLIEVPDEEYDLLGSNVLSLGGRRCLVLQGSPKTKAALLEAGATVMEYPGRDLSYFGTGGPTCLTCPLLRE